VRANCRDVERIKTSSTRWSWSCGQFNGSVYHYIVTFDQIHARCYCSRSSSSSCLSVFIIDRCRCVKSIMCLGVCVYMRIHWRIHYSRFLPSFLLLLLHASSRRRLVIHHHRSVVRNQQCADYLTTVVLYCHISSDDDNICKWSAAASTCRYAPTVALFESQHQVWPVYLTTTLLSSSDYILLVTLLFCVVQSCRKVLRRVANVVIFVRRWPKNVSTFSY